MLITHRFAALFPASKRNKVEAWLATHEMETPVVGVALGSIGLAVGTPSVLGFFAVGACAGYLVKHVVSDISRTWSLPHDCLKDACLSVEQSMRQCGIKKPEALRSQALQQWSYAWAPTLYPYDTYPIEDYPIGRSMIPILTPIMANAVLMRDQATSPHDHMHAAYWLALERSLIKRMDYKVGRADFVLPHIEHSQSALLQELLMLSHNKDNSIYRIATRMGARFSGNAMDIPNQKSWYQEMLGDLASRYPAFAPVLQSLEAVYGPVEQVNPLEIRRLLRATSINPDHPAMTLPELNI